jgi:adenylylsulfate reductase subunit A
LAEGEIAGESALRYCREHQPVPIEKATEQQHLDEVAHFLGTSNGQFSTEQLEEAMQTVMDSYAGGIKTNYRFNEKQLAIADEKIVQLIELAETLHAEDFQALMHIYELKERLVVCRSVIAHLRARQETRWHSFAENLDYPEKDDKNWRKYVNSRLVDGKIQIILRDLVEGGQTYEHCH